MISIEDEELKLEAVDGAGLAGAGTLGSVVGLRIGRSVPSLGGVEGRCFEFAIECWPRRWPWLPSP